MTTWSEKGGTPIDLMFTPNWLDQNAGRLSEDGGAVPG